MCEEVLVQFVQSYPPLYDTSTMSYHNKNIKENCWRKVAKQFSISGKIVYYFTVILSQVFYCVHMADICCHAITPADVGN